MSNIDLKKQNGVTLIEVLGALAILSIIAVLAFNVLGSTFQYNERTQAHTDIRQEANYIITQMRQSHQANDEDYDICTSEFQTDNYTFNEFMIHNNPINDSCTTVNATEPLPVSFVINNNQGDEFQVNTTIHAKAERNIEETIAITMPDGNQSFIDYVRNENVFVYSSSVPISGGSSIKGENGQLVLNNNTPSDVNFDTAGEVSVNKIHINKPGQQINVTTSTQFGQSSNIEIINIRGDLNLNNGGIRINAEEIYIDGNLTINRSAEINSNSIYVSGNLTIKGDASINTDLIQVGGTVSFDGSSTINGNTVFIREDVIFNNSGDSINASNIYIKGEFIDNADSHNNDNTNPQTGEFRSFTIDFPNQPPNDLPELREENWYSENDFVNPNPDNSTTLDNNARIYSSGDVDVNTEGRNPSNVIIVSGGDVSIDTYWNEVNGLIVAPNGSVSYNGPKFSGVVIAKDGFTLVNDGSSAEFTNINEYLDGLDEIPFQ